MKNKSIPGYLIGHARPVCFIFLIITLVCAWLSGRFEINASAETLLVKDNALYLQSRLYNQRFSPEEFVLVGYRPRDGELFSARRMEALQALSETFLTLDRVENVNAITSVPLIRTENDFSAQFDPQELTWISQKYSAEVMDTILTDHPIYTDLLVNADKTATAIQIVFQENEELSEINADLLLLQRTALEQQLTSGQLEQMEQLEIRKEQLESRLADTRNEEIREIYNLVEPYTADADIYLGGNYVLAFHLVEIITQDLTVFGIAIVAIVGILLLVVFRDWRWLFLPLLCCLVSVVITIGLFGALDFQATVISSNFIALQLILTLAIVIHLIVHYQYLSEVHTGSSHRELLVQTVSEKASPCFFAGLTTSVGFAALLISNLQPVITFGWMMIVAMLVSISSSLVLFPCVMGLFHSKPSLHRSSIAKKLLSGFLKLCSYRQKHIIIASVIVTLIMAAGMLRLEAENSFINYFSDSTQIYKELTFIDTQLGGSTPLDIIYRPQSSGRESENLVLEAQTSRVLQAIQQSLEQSRAVGKVMSVVNFTQLARELNGDRPLTEYELNSLYTIVDSSLRERLIGAYLNQDSNEFRINARIIDTTPELDRQVFLEAVRTTMSNLDIQEDQYTLTNLFVLYQDILQRLMNSQVNTIALVFIALWIVMIGIFRSPVIAAIALIPNIIVTVFILGLMGWLSIPLDLMTITIAAIAMGIAVDDTIHFIHHFLNEKTSTNLEKLETVFNTVGYALLYTSLVIATGFSVLGFSDFVPSIIFGLLTSAAIVMAFLIDLSLLPVLLVAYLDRSEKRNQE